MKNFIQLGNTVTVTLTADVESGDGLLVNNLFGIAAVDGETGDEIEMQVAGVFALPKVPADEASQFDAAYWDDGEKKVTATATDNTLIGVFMRPYANGTAASEVRLNGVAAFETASGDPD